MPVSLLRRLSFATLLGNGPVPLCCGSVLLGWLLTASVLLASSGTELSLPPTRNPQTMAFSPQSGLNITVDTNWSGTRGYKPVKVDFVASQLLTADVQVTFRFYAGGWGNQARSIAVERDFELSRDSLGTSFIVPVPQYSDWNTIGWEVWIDGQLDRALSIEAARFVYPGGELRTSCLLLTTGRQDQFADIKIKQLLGQSVDIASLSLNVAPERFEQPLDQWIHLSQIDLVVLTLDQLRTVLDQYPQHWENLMRWVRTGGNLWILDAGEEFSEIADVEKALNVPPSEALPTETEEISRIESRGWLLLPRNDDVSLFELTGGREPQEDQDEVEPLFVTRLFGIGTVTVFQNPDSQPLDYDHRIFDKARDTPLQDRLEWQDRHGNDPNLGNRRFYNFLIPEVGVSPVLEFQLLLSLFVIVIGPLNYWLLRRHGKLTLLLVTVPVAAVLTTLILFGYGFIADGLGLKVRARSLTYLDQRTGEAACWSRLSYYAGIAPSDGLEFPADTTVYPILPMRSERSNFTTRWNEQLRQVEWEESQRLTRGWLASRTPTQYLTVSAHPTTSRLDLRIVDDELRIKNQLGVDIKALLVQDRQGQFYFSEQPLAAEQRTSLPACEFSDAMSSLRNLFREDEPEFAPGTEVLGSWRNRRRRSYSFSAPGLMEEAFTAMVSPTATGWGNSSYIAIVDKAPRLPLGSESAQESDSFHVVRGEW